MGCFGYLLANEARNGMAKLDCEFRDMTTIAVVLSMQLTRFHGNKVDGIIHLSIHLVGKKYRVSLLATNCPLSRYNKLIPNCYQFNFGSIYFIRRTK